MLESSLESVLEPLTDGTRYDMRDWQADDLVSLLELESSANWSEMGAFKTSTGLWLLDKASKAADIPSKPKALIITSKGGKGTYFDALPKCIPDWRVINLSVRKCVERVGDAEFDIDLEGVLQDMRLGYFNHPTVILAHYDCFTNNAGKDKVGKKWTGKSLTDKLKNMDWTFLLVDEAHKMKNRDAQWTKNIKKLHARIRHVMTGTGFTNNPAEIWSLLNFLDKVEYNDYWKFRTYYCDEYMDGRGFRVITGLRPYRVQEFRDMRIGLGPRRMMTEVHPDIGKPIEASYEVELNAIQRRMYNDIKQVLQTLDQAGEQLTSPNVLSQLNRLRQISVATPEVVDSRFDVKANRLITEVKLVEPSSKLDRAMELIQELDEQKVVVFSCFRDPLHLLAERLDKKHIPYIHMQQKHNDQQRYEMWHDRFPNSEARVFMSTLALGGESINLACAKYMIMLDRSWSPKDMMQAIGRIYRPGQTGIAEIIYINAKNTVDTYVKSKLDRKGKWFDEIFGSNDA